MAAEPMPLPAALGWVFSERSDVGAMYRHAGLKLRVLVDAKIPGLLSVSRHGSATRRPRLRDLERVRRDWALDDWREVRRGEGHIMLMEPGAYEAYLQRGGRRDESN